MSKHKQVLVTPKSLLEGPPMVPLWPTAGRALLMSRAKTYGLVREGKFPVPVQTIGSRLRVRRADLLAYLGIEDPYVQPRAVEAS